MYNFLLSPKAQNQTTNNDNCTFFKRKPTLLFNGSCDQTCTFINLFMLITKIINFLYFHRIELFLADIPMMLKPCHFGLPPQEQLIFQCTQTTYKKLIVLWYVNNLYSNAPKPSELRLQLLSTQLITKKCYSMNYWWTKKNFNISGLSFHTYQRTDK